MLKRRIIFSVIFAICILLIVFWGKEFLPENNEFKKEMMQMDNFHHPMKNNQIYKKYSPAKYKSNEFQAGMNVLIYGHPDILEAKEVFFHLRSLGINSIAINFPIYQESIQANEVTISKINTPSVQELQQVIHAAHDVDLSVMLRPIMDEQAFLSTSNWRGQIKPNDPNAWFESYEKLLLTYAKLAESSNIKSLNIGTELNSMQRKHSERWASLIENVRKVYHGEVTYSFNWDTVHEIPTNDFVSLLDYVGIDIYFPLQAPDSASAEMLEKAWNNRIKQFKKNLKDVPIVVTEAGIIPIKGVYRTPYVWSKPDGKLDRQAQGNYYEATYNVWKPMIEGIYWWCVTLGEEPGEIGYSPLHSPTEEILKKHFLKGYPGE